MASRIELLETLKLRCINTDDEYITFEFESYDYVSKDNPFMDSVAVPYMDGWGFWLSYDTEKKSVTYIPYEVAYTVEGRDAGAPYDEIELSEEEIDVLKSKMNKYAEPIIKMLKGDF